MSEILVTSIISHRDQLPRIDITLNGNRVQLSSMEARALAQNILQAVAASESDAFIWHFVNGDLKKDRELASMAVIAFRDFRDKLETDWRNGPEETGKQE